jgi:hypothetical protein
MAGRIGSPPLTHPRLELVLAGAAAEIRLDAADGRSPGPSTAESPAYLRIDKLATVFTGDGAAIPLPIDPHFAAANGREPSSRPIEVVGSAANFDARASWALSDVGDASYFEVTLRVRYTGSEPRDTALRVSVQLMGEGRPWFMIPGLFYRENRLEGCRRIYPRWDFDGGDSEGLVSDTWSFRGDRAAAAAVFGWNGALSAGLAADEETQLGLTGLGFAGNASRAEIWLDFPFREEPVVFTGHPPPSSAERTFHAWSPGEEVALRFQVFLATADPHDYDPFLRVLYRRRQATNRLSPWVQPAEAALLTAEALFKWHYRPDDDVLYETIGFDRENVSPETDRPAMHVAWVSGVPYAYALLTYGQRTGDGAYVRAATRVIDKIASALTPAGTFWGEWRLGKGWRAGWNANPRLVHARTLAEATLFTIRSLAFERDAGRSHSEGEAAALSNLRFAVRHQDTTGNFGAYYDTATGEVAEWQGAAGILWIAALVEGAALFDERTFRESALRAGSWYRRFVDDQFIFGAPEDVHLAPTSEDGYNAVIAFVLLHEADGEGDWLAVASRAADWMLTFRWTYNTTFPAHTILREYDFRTRGGDQASSAIQILHPYGLICLPEMARLARYTGDEYYRDRTRDNLACFLQFVARADGDFGAYRGMVTERYYHTNAFQAKGMLLTLSHAWCVGVTLYACQEAELYPEVVPAGAAEEGVAGARSR